MPADRMHSTGDSHPFSALTEDENGKPHLAFDNLLMTSKSLFAALKQMEFINGTKLTHFI